MKGRSVLILGGGHLSTAPRIIKEAQALRRAGADVSVLGTWWSEELAMEDGELATECGVAFAPALDFRPGARGRLWSRFRQRLAATLFRRFGLVTPRSFGLGAPELLREARARSADLTMVHSEAGLWVARRMLDAGHRVGVDFEDWFSEDLLPEDRAHRPVCAIATLEDSLLAHASVCTTTSEAMAQGLAGRAGTTRVPAAIPNCFPAGERARVTKPVARDSKGVAFHWFSQTIGPGRGLEILARAMDVLRGDWRVSLRGNLNANRDWFAVHFGSIPSNRVRVESRVPNASLLQATMAYDVGLALELPYCRNKDLTASNKIFEYFRAGLAVIATRTAGHQETLDRCPLAGELVAPYNYNELTVAMQRLVDDPTAREAMKKASFLAGSRVWAWESHEQRLVDAIASGFDRGSPHSGSCS